MKKDRNEELLKVWLRVSVGINNEKVVSDLPYNESLICNLLYCSMLEQPQQELTATDLCRKIRMQKSQMNRTLNSMEEKGLILRERSSLDRRQVFVRLNPDKLGVYQAQHQKILDIIDAIVEKVGVDTADEAVRILNLIADTAAEVLK